jgi:hypothetical protein
MSKEPQAQAFTASEIARFLNRKRQTVQSLLHGIPPSTEETVNGNLARKWAVSALPEKLQTLIEAARAHGGYRTECQVIRSTRKTSVAPNWNEVPSEAQSHAAKLKKALWPSLVDPARLELERENKGEFERRGIADYEAVFGKKCSPRWFRKLHKKIIYSVGSATGNRAHDFEPLQLYLGKRQGIKVHSERINLIDSEYLSEVLDDVIPGEVTTVKQVQIWLRSFELLNSTIADGISEKMAKKEILQFLWTHAPFLALSQDALRKAFDRKYRAWIQNPKPEALKDARRERSGNYRGPFVNPKEEEYCRRLLKWVAAKMFKGDMLPAFKYLLAGRAYVNDQGVEHRWPQHVRDYYLHYGNRVPRRFQMIGTEAKELARYEQAPRAYEINCPYNDRDWSRVCSMDWLQMDDVTPPVIWYEEDGFGWFNLMRGQFLPAIDLRSLKALAFSLRSAPGYNAIQIRTTITRACMKHGIFRKGAYFERGIWERAKLVGGGFEMPLSAGREELPWEETEVGLKALFGEIRHAHIHRAKPIEPMIGLLQNLMEAEPGYVGRNERDDFHERVQRQIKEVESRKTHPGKYFYSKAEWMNRLSVLLFDEHNNKKSYGKALLDGLSPNEAFEKFANKENPVIKFDRQIFITLRTFESR